MFQKSAPQIKGTSLPFTHINGVISIFSSLAISGGFNCLANQNNTYIFQRAQVTLCQTYFLNKFYAPSHGVVGFVVSVSSRKHLRTDWNSSIANLNMLFEQFLKLTLTINLKVPTKLYQKMFFTMGQKGNFPDKKQS